MCVSCRRCRASPGSSERAVKMRIDCTTNVLLERLSGYLLRGCLLKLIFCCVRVSDHVLCRRVALLAPRPACRGVGAGLVRLCRLQRRHVDAIFPGCKQSLQLSAGLHGLRAATRARAAGRAPAALCVLGLWRTAGRCGAAILSERQCRRLRGRAGDRVLHAAGQFLRAAGPAAPRGDRQRAAALGRGGPAPGPYQDHRRYQRYAGVAGASLSRGAGRDPGG